jgi:hyperosmotically inducible protein
MKFIRYYLVLLAAILAFSTLDAQAQSTTRSRVVSQADIERKVYKEILKLPYYELFDHIAFKVDGSTVTLYGKVFNARNKDDAEDEVKEIPGVERVINNIEILPPSPFDNRIRRDLVRTFANSGGSLYRFLQGPNPSMRIIVDGGHVTLEGFVSNRGDYNLANILANGVPGVFSVKNNLVIDKERAR